MIIKVAVDGCSKGIANIEEAVPLEGLWEHADVLEVNDVETSSLDVEEEVAFANVGVTDGELIRQGDGQCRVSWAARKRLREKNGSIGSYGRLRFIPC